MKNVRMFYNKYKNKSCKCKLEHIHDSRGEANYCNELQLQKKIGEIKDFEIQKTFDLKVNDKLITRHRVDFLITNKENKLEVREFKGFETDVWIIKKRLFEAIYKEIPYIVIKCYT